MSERIRMCGGDGGARRLFWSERASARSSRERRVLRRSERAPTPASGQKRRRAPFRPPHSRSLAPPRRRRRPPIKPVDPAHTHTEVRIHATLVFALEKATGTQRPSLARSLPLPLSLSRPSAGRSVDRRADQLRVRLGVRDREKERAHSARDPTATFHPQTHTVKRVLLSLLLRAVSPAPPWWSPRGRDAGQLPQARAPNQNSARGIRPTINSHNRLSLQKRSSHSPGSSPLQTPRRSSSSTEPAPTKHPTRADTEKNETKRENQKGKHHADRRRAIHRRAWRDAPRRRRPPVAVARLPLLCGERCLPHDRRDHPVRLVQAGGRAVRGAAVPGPPARGPGGSLGQEAGALRVSDGEEETTSVLFFPCRRRRFLQALFPSCFERFFCGVFSGAGAIRDQERPI